MVGATAYQKVIKIDQPTYKTPPDSLMRIELLEDGIKNHLGTIDECRNTLAYNRKQFNSYVANNKTFTSTTNYTIIRKDREIKRLTTQVENLTRRLNDQVKKADRERTEHHLDGK